LVVATPHGRSTSGFGTQWCSYHSFTYTDGGMLSYTNLPYLPDAEENCRARGIRPPKDESRRDEGVTIVEGAMYGDSITDPNPGAGWYNFAWDEISAPCAGTGLKNVKFGDKSYTTAPMYSNANQTCVQEYKSQ
jgi:hypothetical protein